MALAAVNVTIVIDRESYSIVEIPPQTSGIVIKQKEGLLQQVNLKVNMYIHAIISNTADTSAGLAVCCSVVVYSKAEQFSIRMHA